MKNKIFVLAALVVAVLVFGSVVLFSEKPRPVADAATEVTQTAAVDSAPVAAESDTPQFVRAHSPDFGNKLSRVMVVEWFDPECESCARVHPFVKKVVEDYEQRVRFVLRYMPYHQNSMYAASVLEEAAELGKFLESLEILFEKQSEWGDHHHPRPELIPTYLAKLGIPAQKLGRDYVIKKHGSKIKKDEADGNALGVNGTPTFFVNGKPIENLSETALRQAIDAALQNSKPQ